MAQLLIRPSLNDHLVVADLIAPPVAQLWRPPPPIAQLVVDAHIATRRPRFAEAANEAGIPLMIDPMTPLLQFPVHPANSWAKLPFAEAEPLPVSCFAPERLVEEVVDFQVKQGATCIVAPYLYGKDPSDPAFAMSIRLLANTAQYLEDANIPLPLVAVFCGQLRSFARRDALAQGVRRFLAAARDHGAGAVGVCVSPAGAPTDSYAKLVEVFRVASAVMESGLPGIAWRQGIYGPALVAAGLDGYETGIGTQEQTQIARQAANRKKEPDKGRGGGGAGIYFDPLGRSVPKRTAEVLLRSKAMAPKLMCDDEACCPNGVRDTLEKSRPHAIRTRARELADLDRQPHQRWRIHHIEQQVQGAITLSRQANRVLEAEGVTERIKFGNLESLGRVLAEWSEVGEVHRTA